MGARPARGGAGALTEPEFRSPRQRRVFRRGVSNGGAHEVITSDRRTGRHTGDPGVVGPRCRPPVLTARVAAAAATNGASDEASPRPDEDRGTVYVGDVGSALDAAVISLSRDGRTITRLGLTLSVACGAPSYNRYSELMTATAIPVGTDGHFSTVRRWTGGTDVDNFAAFRHRIRLDGMVHGRDLVGWLKIESDVLGPGGVVSQTCAEIATLDVRSSPGELFGGRTAQGAPLTVSVLGTADVKFRVYTDCRPSGSGHSDSFVFELPLRAGRFHRTEHSVPYRMAARVPEPLCQPRKRPLRRCTGESAAGTSQAGCGTGRSTRACREAAIAAASSSRRTAGDDTCRASAESLDEVGPPAMCTTSATPGRVPRSSATASSASQCSGHAAAYAEPGPEVDEGPRTPVIAV